MDKVICPNCGYKMPIRKGKKAQSIDIWVKCKGKDCKKEFEIKIENKS